MFKNIPGNYFFCNTINLLKPFEKKSSTYGLKSIAYLGVKLWYGNVCNFSDDREIEFSTLTTCIDDIWVAARCQ